MNVEIKLKVAPAPGPHMAMVSLQTGESKIGKRADFEPKTAAIGIVKVQVPVAGRLDTPAMVYNRDRSFQVFAEVTPTLRQALPAFKGYFRCRVDAGELVLLSQVGAQSW